MAQEVFDVFEEVPVDDEPFVVLIQYEDRKSERLAHGVAGEFDVGDDVAGVVVAETGVEEREMVRENMKKGLSSTLQYLEVALRLWVDTESAYGPD